MTSTPMTDDHDWNVNRNRIVTDGFSRRASEKLYRARWPDDPESRARYETGRACCSCAFYSDFNEDWGLCHYRRSRHYLETVFEHFTCPSYVDRARSESQDP